MKTLAAALAGTMLAAVSIPSAAPAQEFSDAEREEIGEIVREYLIENPTVLEEVLVALEAHQSQAQSEAQTQALVANKARIFDSERSYVAGNPDGDVTLVEFFDYNCGFCKQMLPQVMELVDGDSDLRLVLKEWPVLGEDSAAAARVAVAVRREAPDSYFEFHQALMAERGGVDAARALDLAEDMGLSRVDLELAMQSPEVEQTLMESLELGNALRLRGTPTYILGDEVLMGAVDLATLREKIAHIRENGCEVC